MKYTPIMADGMSGSIGGLVASRNKSGVYFRRRAIPVNPNSTRQQAVRSNFTSLVNYWTNTLSDAQRALWNDYASNTPLPATPSGLKVVTGQNMFIRSNAVRLQIGASIIAAAPTVYNTGEPVTGLEGPIGDTNPGHIGVDNGGLQWQTTFLIAGGASDDGDLCVYLGSTLNPTREFYKGPYQLVGAVAITSSDTSEDFTTLFSAALNGNGNPINGQIRGVAARIMYDDGRLSQLFRAIAPVTEAAP